MVSIAAFQAVDPGSIPGWRRFLLWLELGRDIGLVWIVNFWSTLQLFCLNHDVSAFIDFENIMYLTEKGAPQYIYLYCRCWSKLWNLWILTVNMFCQSQWFRHHERWRFLYIFGGIGMPQDDNYLLSDCLYCIY